MKVLQILYSGLGGHGSVALSLIGGDSDKVCQHELLFYGIEDLLPAYAKFCERKNVPYAFIKKKPGVNFSDLKAVVNHVKQVRPDAIVLHSPGLLILPLWWFCKISKCRLIIVEHTSNEVKGRFEFFMGLIGLFLARKTVYLTKFYQEQIIKKYSWVSVLSRSVVIPNGIDLDRYTPVHTDGSDNCIHAGMIGRFLFPKNQESLVEAILKLNKLNVNNRIVLHFAGNGGFEEKLREVVKSRGISEQIIFHGLLDEDQIIRFFQSIQIYVHASNAEAMCTSIMQAMACGLPVLASNIPGINNIAVNGVSALLYNNENPDELVDGFISMQDPALRTKYGVAGRRIAEEEFSNKSSFRSYLKLFS